MSWWSCRRSTSEMPWIVLAKSEFSMLGTTKPITLDRLEERLPASLFGM
jgi:hypothetical protein